MPAPAVAAPEDEQRPLALAGVSLLVLVGASLGLLGLLLRTEREVGT